MSYPKAMHASGGPTGPTGPGAYILGEQRGRSYTEWRATFAGYRFFALFCLRGAAADSLRMLGERGIALSKVESGPGCLVIEAMHKAGEPSLLQRMRVALSGCDAGVLSVWLESKDRATMVNHLRRIDVHFSGAEWLPLRLDASTDETAQDRLALHVTEYGGPFDDELSMEPGGV